MSKEKRPGAATGRRITPIAALRRFFVPEEFLFKTKANILFGSSHRSHFLRRHLYGCNKQKMSLDGRPKAGRYLVGYYQEITPCTKKHAQRMG